MPASKPFHVPLAKSRVARRIIMPDEASLDEVKRVLLESEAATVAAIEQIKESTVPAEFDGSIGRLTRIDAHQQQQMALHGQQSLEVKLARIRAALDRVRQGTYGACAECGTAMPAGRLEATPEVPFCLACQERFERRGRG
jgi:DnaK suppressor protein